MTRAKMRIVAAVLIVSTALVQGQTDPWDCQFEENETPTEACIAQYTDEWFPSQSAIDNRCVAESCIPNPQSGFVGGCLLLTGPNGNDKDGYTAEIAKGESYGTIDALCGTFETLSIPVGTTTNPSEGTPSDPLGRCSDLDGIFSGQQPMYVWCGEQDERPPETTPVYKECECEGCAGGSSGECKYNGKDGQITFVNQCASYFQRTGACFDFEGEGVTSEDCCASDDEPTVAPPVTNPNYCPDSVCKSGEGPCIFGYTPNKEEGENICLSYLIEGICYPHSDECSTLGILGGGTTKKPEDEITTPTTTEQPTGPTKDPTDIYGEHCTDCFAGTSGPCRSNDVVPNTDTYVCLPYLTGTDTLRDTIVWGDQQTGPQCMQTTTKCRDWTTLVTETTSTSTSVTKTTVTTVTTITTTPKKDATGTYYAHMMNQLVNEWEELYCEGGGNADATGLQSVETGHASETINTGMVRAWMSNKYHSEAQDEMQSERLPEDVGAGLGETLCEAGPNKDCICKGLVRRSIKPSVSWGTFNCTADTFQTLSNPFEPALNNGDGNCYCTEGGLEDIDHVMTSKDLIELAQQVGAARRCNPGKSSGPDTNTDFADGEALNPFVRSDGTHPTRFINTKCSKECRGANGADLDQFMVAAGYTNRGSFLADAAEKLEATFAYIFRYNQNDLDTEYNNFEVSAVSEGDSELRNQHLAYDFQSEFTAYRNQMTDVKSANERFEAADLPYGDLYLAVGSQRAAGTQTGCYPGGLKHGLGMCSCAKEVYPGTTLATDAPATVNTTTTPATTTSSTGTTTLYDPYSCFFGAYKGPLVGYKPDRDIFKQVLIVTVKAVATLEDCAALCTAEPKGACTSFGWKEEDDASNLGDDPRSACSIYRDFEVITDAVAFFGAFDHYWSAPECITTMAPPTMAPPTLSTITATAGPATTTTQGAPTTTATYGTPALSALPMIEGAQCLFVDSPVQIDVCQANCASQHECVGVFYYYNPDDHYEGCETKRLASVQEVDAGSGDLFDRMATCNVTNNFRCGNKCANHETCSNDQSCIPCITTTVKAKKCNALYGLKSAAEKLRAGVDAKPLTSCTMLTAFCSGLDCQKLVPETFVRSISFSKAILGLDGTTTATSTATSTAATTATTTASSTMASTESTTAKTTETSTAVSTATSTASRTQITTQTTTQITTQTTTAVTSPSTTAVTTPSTTIVTTLTTTVTTSVTSTATSTVASTVTTTPVTTQTTTPTTTTVTTSTTSTVTVSTTTTTTGAFLRYKQVYSTAGLVGGRRFGNAFKAEDRLFLQKFDGSKTMKKIGAVDVNGKITGAGAACRERCDSNPLCLGIFAWNQLDHVAEADRKNPDAAGFNCVGLTSEAIYGNYFSHDNYMSDLTADELAIALSISVQNSTVLSYGTQPDQNLISHPTYGFKGDSISIIKEFVWNAADGSGPCTVGSVDGIPYNGACLHRETGFCMEEVPGTAQCLAGFEHRGTLYIEAAREES